MVHIGTYHAVPGRVVVLLMISGGAIDWSRRLFVFPKTSTKNRILYTWAMSDKPLSITITVGTVIKVLLVAAIAWALYYLRDIVLIILTAIVIASAIEPAAKWFGKYKVPRVAAVLIIYLTFFGSFFGLIYFFLPPVLSETAGFVTSLPQYLEVFNRSDLVASLPLIGTGGSDQSALADAATQISGILHGFATDAVSTASSIFGGVFSFLLIIVFSFYFAVQDTGVEDFLRIVAPAKQKHYVVDLWKRAQHKIGLWMQGQIILGLIIGVLVYLMLSLFQVKYALILAVTAALFELIPVFGPVFSAVPGVVVAFVDGGVSLGLTVLLMYVIIQQFENHLIYPLVVTKVVGVPPLLVILALIIGAKLAGFLGILLSVPAAAAIQEFVKDFEHRRHFMRGEELA